MLKIANVVFNSMLNDSRVIKESMSLSNAGYVVEVIAHLDKGLLEVEKKENFIIKRFAYLDRKITKSFYQKLKIYLEYLKKSISYCKYFDIIHCNDLNTLPIAFVIKTFFNKKIKIVYDAHEYETETNSLKGFNQKLIRVVERFLIRYVDSTICVSNTISDEYSRLYNIKKPSVILNTPLYKKITKNNLFRENLKISAQQNIFLYQGALTHGRGIEMLLSTFKKVNSKNVIIFMGYGPLEKLIKNEVEKYSNIYFYDAVSPTVLLEYTSSADYGISTIEDSCLSYRYCLPNKMFEYIMAEIPLIVSNLPEMKKLVKDNKIGIVMNEDNERGLNDAIEKVLLLDKKELVKNIQNIKQDYNWEEQEKVLLNIYKGLK